MSIDDGKLLYDSATGKLMYDRATGKLLYGLDVDVFTYAKMDITAGTPATPAVFKLLRAFNAIATAWTITDSNDPDWNFASLVTAPTGAPTGYDWTVTYDDPFTSAPYTGTLTIPPALIGGNPHDYPAGVYTGLSMTLIEEKPPIPPPPREIPITFTLTLSESPILPFT